MFIEALMIGMTYEQFWYDDPNLFFLYLKAYERKAKAELDQIDYTCWLQGAYIDYALAINHPFAKKKEKYLEHPFGYEEPKAPALSDEEKEKQELAAAALQIAQFERYAKAYNQQYFNK